MAITEAERSALCESMWTVHGPDIAESFMTIFPSGTTEEPATKRDLDELRLQLRGDMGSMKADLLRTFGTWLFVSQASVIAANAMVVALVR